MACTCPPVPTNKFVSTSMQRITIPALVASVIGTVPAYGQLMPVYPVNSQPRFATQYQQPSRGNLGGGFIEALFGNGQPALPAYGGRAAYQDPEYRESLRYEMNPAYQRQVVDYGGGEKAGTIIIDTPKRFLYLVQDN